MAQNSKIEWTDHTVNFWWGCMKVSPGCAHCYAEALSKRTGRQIWGPAATTERWRTKGPWLDILKWDKMAAAEGVRRRVFAQSMSDFFEEHPQLVTWRAEACAILEQLQWLDIQLLTKRPENIKRMVPAHWLEKWPAHIWVGTSVENQEVAPFRLRHLMYVPAAVRFISAEPLLGPLQIANYLSLNYFHGIDWVIVGAESGHNARSMKEDWVRLLRDQTSLSDAAFFYKQKVINGQKISLPLLDGWQWAEFPNERSLHRHVAKLAEPWPPMPDLEGGIDHFSQYPVAGEA